MFVPDFFSCCCGTDRIAFCRILWYPFYGATDKRQAVCPSAHQGAILLAPCFYGKGGCLMVTYSDLFQYTMVLIGLVGLFIAAWNIKKK